MTTIALAIGLGAVFVGLALAMASATVIGSQRQQVARSLAAVEAIHSAPKAMVEQLDLPFVDRVLGPSKDRFVQLGRRISPAGQTQKIRFRIEQPGTYMIECSVEGHAQSGMTGSLIVEAVD